MKCPMMYTNGHIGLPLTGASQQESNAMSNTSPSLHPHTCARRSSVHSLSHTLLAAAFTGRFSFKAAWISSATPGASRNDRETEKPVRRQKTYNRDRGARDTIIAAGHQHGNRTGRQRVGKGEIMSRVRDQGRASMRQRMTRQWQGG